MFLFNCTCLIGLPVVFILKSSQALDECKMNMTVGSPVSKSFCNNNLSLDVLQVAVCNLASIALNMFVGADKTYDFQKLRQVTKVIVRNLNKIIDINYYPVPEVRKLLMHVCEVMIEK